MLPTAPASAAHPMEPAPAVRNMHPAPTTAPAAKTTIWPAFWETQLLAVLTALHAQDGQHSPSGSVKVTGLLFAYAYPFIDCGLWASKTGSPEMKRPVVGSYSRAPRCVRPVGSVVPPTNPRVLGQLPGGPRTLPYGSSNRVVTCWVSALIARVPVPWWSWMSQVTPAAVRIAMFWPACESSGCTRP